MQTAVIEQKLTIFGPPVRGRSCGSCKACCTQVPVELPGGIKRANVRCPALRAKGCGVYANRPQPCRAWSCRWLFDEMAGDLRRPDLSGSIVDPDVDTIILDGEAVECIQVWVDPNRRDAHRAPELRAYLGAMAEKYRLPALIRWSSQEGMGLLAPCLTGQADWIEVDSTMNSQQVQNAKIAAAGGAAHLMQLEASWAP